MFMAAVPSLDRAGDGRSAKEREVEVTLKRDPGNDFSEAGLGLLIC